MNEKDSNSTKKPLIRDNHKLWCNNRIWGIASSGALVRSHAFPFMLTDHIPFSCLALSLSPQCHDGVHTTTTCVLNTTKRLSENRNRDRVDTISTFPHILRRPSRRIKWIRWTYPTTCCGRARQSLCRPCTANAPAPSLPAVIPSWDLLPRTNSGRSRRTFSCPVSFHMPELCTEAIAYWDFVLHFRLWFRGRW